MLLCHRTLFWVESLNNKYTLVAGAVVSPFNRSELVNSGLTRPHSLVYDDKQNRFAAHSCYNNIIYYSLTNPKGMLCTRVRYNVILIFITRWYLNYLKISKMGIYQKEWECLVQKCERI